MACCPAINKCISVFFSELPSEQTKSGTENGTERNQTESSRFSIFSTLCWRKSRWPCLVSGASPCRCPCPWTTCVWSSIKANGLQHDMTRATRRELNWSWVVFVDCPGWRWARDTTGTSCALKKNIINLEGNSWCIELFLLLSLCSQLLDKFLHVQREVKQSVIPISSMVYSIYGMSIHMQPSMALNMIRTRVLASGSCLLVACGKHFDLNMWHVSRHCSLSRPSPLYLV